MKYAVIDVGSNTVRLSVYRVENKKFEQLFTVKETVGLAGYIKEKKMSEEGMEQAARTLNFLTENRIGSYAELSAKIAEVNAANEQAAGALKGIERRLADMAVLIKNVTTYQKTKPVYDAYRRAKDKAAYRAAHASSIILFEAAAKAVKPALVGGKLPSVAALQAEYAALGEQKETLYADYGRLKKQVREYDVIKRNIDSILRRESEPERGKENVRG